MPALAGEFSVCDFRCDARRAQRDCAPTRSRLGPILPGLPLYPVEFPGSAPARFDEFLQSGLSASGDLQ